MKIRRLLPAIVIALAALAPSLAAAQDARGPGWDFGIDVIYQFSDEIDFDGGTQLDFDDDVGLTLVFGYRFDPKFELRFEFDWATVDYNGTLRSASLPNVDAAHLRRHGILHAAPQRRLQLHRRTPDTVHPGRNRLQLGRHQHSRRAGERRLLVGSVVSPRSARPISRRSRSTSSPTRRRSACAGTSPIPGR